MVVCAFLEEASGKFRNFVPSARRQKFCHDSGLGHFRGWFSVICNQELILGSIFLEWAACYLSLKFCMVCFPCRRIQSFVIFSVCILLCILHIWPFSSLSCAPRITFYGSGHLNWTTSRSRLFSTLRWQNVITSCTQHKSLSWHHNTFCSQTHYILHAVE